MDAQLLRHPSSCKDSTGKIIYGISFETIEMITRGTNEAV
jgi:hypothetical protein